MIPFNAPPVVGTELDYMQSAMGSGKQHRLPRQRHAGPQRAEQPLYPAPENQFLSQRQHGTDPQNRPADSVWPGKADLYHAAQATLIPTLPLAPSLATALARGLHA